MFKLSLLTIFSPCPFFRRILWSYSKTNVSMVDYCVFSYDIQMKGSLLLGNRKGCLITIIVNLSTNLRNVLFVIDTTKPPPPSSGEKSLNFYRFIKFCPFHSWYETVMMMINYINSSRVGFIHLFILKNKQKPASSGE